MKKRSVHSVHFLDINPGIPEGGVLPYINLIVIALKYCQDLDCEHSLIFLCKVTARETKAGERQSREPRETRAQSLIVIITSWFAIALDEIRTRRILREKADCKQSSQD